MLKYSIFLSFVFSIFISNSQEIFSLPQLMHVYDGIEVPSKPSNSFSSDIQGLNFELNDHSTFGVGFNSGDSILDKSQSVFWSTILAALYRADYELVMDFFDYSKSDQVNSLTKQLVRFYIHELPIVSNSQFQKLNSGEYFSSSEFEDWGRLEQPILIDYYFSFTEKNKGILSESHTNIRLKDTQYTVNQRGELKAVYLNDTILHASEGVFTYYDNQHSWSVFGGLGIYILQQHLNFISNELLLDAQRISKTSDVYNSNLLELNRHVGKGKVEIDFPNINWIGGVLVKKSDGLVQLADGSLETTKYYDSGKRKERFKLLNNQLEGVYTVWNEEGYVISEMNYQNGVKSGVSKSYDEKGNLISEEFYLSGKKEGLQKEYFSDGSVKSVSYFKDGLPIGKHYFYYQNGGRKEVVKYKKSHEKSWHKYYNENGKLVKKVK